MKIGLDIHGTIDAHRKFFSELTNIIQQANETIIRNSNNGQRGIALHEVHILTGPSEAKLKPGELEGIYYTHFYSVVDDCTARGVAVMHDEHGEPWMDQYEWNRSKGEYARQHGLDLMIDDSTVYPDFFSTPIATFQTRKE